MPKGVEIKGEKALMKMLQDLGKKVAPKVNRRAVNLATTPLLRAVKAVVPIDKGDLKKSQIKKITNNGLRCNGIVGADADYVGDDGSKPAHYDHLVEYGHMTEDGSMVMPEPYMAEGYDNGIDAARAKYELEIAKGIEREAGK